MRYDRDQIEKHLLNQPRSGMSIVRYCSDQKLCVATFHYWKRKYLLAADHGSFAPSVPSSSPSSLGFTRISAPSFTSSYTLTTPGGSRLDLSSMSIADLASLVRELEDHYA